MKNTHTLTANLMLPHTFSRLRVMMLLLSSSVLASALPVMAGATSLIPDEPSIEVHLEALDSLRGNTPIALVSQDINSGAYGNSPFAVGVSQPEPARGRQRPVNNPISKSQPLPRKPATQYATKPQTIESRATNSQPAKIAQATPVAQPVISQASSEKSVLPNTAKPDQPTFKLPPPPPPRASSNVVTAVPKASPTEAIVQQADPQSAPVPTQSAKAGTNSVLQSTQTPSANAITAQATTQPTLAPTSRVVSGTHVVPSISALDFSKLGQPVAANTSSALPAISNAPSSSKTPTISETLPPKTEDNAKPKAAQVAEPVPNLPALPDSPAHAELENTFAAISQPAAPQSSLDLLKTPEAQKVIAETSQKPDATLSEKLEKKSVSPVLVADATPKNELNSLEKKPADPALKNLSDRMNALFVRTPEKQGVVSDKTAITGAPQNFPALPKTPVPERHEAEKPKQLTLAEVNRLDPPESLSQRDVVSSSIVRDAKPITAITAPSLATDNTSATLKTKEALQPAIAPKPSVVAALNAAAARAPTIPVPSPLQSERREENRPAQTTASAPTLDFSQLKPSKTPVENFAQTAPRSTNAVAVAQNNAPLQPGNARDSVQKPVSVLANVPSTPKQTPGTSTLSKSALPTIPSTPAQAIASADNLASLLPPPEKSSVKRSEQSGAKPITLADAGKVPSQTLPNLSALTNSPASKQDATTALPSLSSITGGTARSSLDIVRDEQGVRSASLEPPATLPPPLPDLPKVTRGIPKQSEKTASPPPIKAAENTVAKPPQLTTNQATVNSQNNKTDSQLSQTSATARSENAVLASTAQNASNSSTGSNQPKPASVARAITVPAASSVSSRLSIPFEKDKVDVQQTMQAKIADVANAVKSDGKNIRIVAYASGKADEASAARRVSLSRALQVRAALINKGVDPMKITVQALGNTGNKGDKAELLVN